MFPILLHSSWHIFKSPQKVWKNGNLNVFYSQFFSSPRASWWQTFLTKQLINKKFNYFPVYFSKSFFQAVQRSLEKLASKGVITEKINGKQKVYAPKQVRYLNKLNSNNNNNKCNNNNNNNNNNNRYMPHYAVLKQYSLWYCDHCILLSPPKRFLLGIQIKIEPRMPASRRHKVVSAEERALSSFFKYF